MDAQQPNSVNEKGKISEVPGVSTAKVYLGEDHVLRVEIDLKVPEGMEVEGRVGAYGTLFWAYEIASRFFTMQEMKRAKKQAEEAKRKAELGVIPVNPGWKPS